MKSVKRLLAITLALVTMLSLGACRKPASGNGAGSGHDFGEPKDSPQSVSAGTFYTVSGISSKYVLMNTNGYAVLNATAPYFEIGGIEHPNDNNGEYYRLDAYSQSTYDGDVAGLAQHMAGVTLRFRTNASTILLYATMRNCTENWNHFPNTGSMGFDVYVGT
ncbi:MAG: hypothetical protein IJD10_01465, partial [Clostridia bacterium]|nr:hypothetical protein [Clostridia bacterium]